MEHFAPHGNMLRPTNGTLQTTTRSSSIVPKKYEGECAPPDLVILDDEFSIIDRVNGKTLINMVIDHAELKHKNDGKNASINEFFDIFREFFCKRSVESRGPEWEPVKLAAIPQKTITSFFDKLEGPFLNRKWSAADKDNDAGRVPQPWPCEFAPHDIESRFEASDDRDDGLEGRDDDAYEDYEGFE
ncbi:hypothetical protein DCS_01121 [Drechmeria coniospora]|uniref:Uncharacterized protein n=1 Tax=Drechmeria coniospora TaxID=98403 RepID=A0A151GS99_DRECN|nr:hypothetical protein DCS_01121 [Drechmeria coniospora]KYK59987.1 hypothetical protein DCS_01121 [Drechmeria coniospora]